MKIRFLAASVLLLASFSSNTYALSLAGYVLKIGSLHAVVDLSGVPNPYTQPTIATGKATLDQIEYLCYNPSNFNVAPGQAGQRIFSSANQVDNSELNLDQKGKATVDITFYKDEGEDGGFETLGPYPCVNPNWTYIPNSAVAKQLTVTLSYYFCAPDWKGDDDPCYDSITGELDITDKKALTAVAVCTLDPERNPDGTVLKGQVYACTQTSP